MQHSITLQTNDSDIVAGDILGRVNFAASNELSGSESQWVGASIYAQASGEFTSNANPTNLVLATSDSEGVNPRFIFTHTGSLLPNLNAQQNLGSSSNNFLNLYATTGIITSRVKIGQPSTVPLYTLDVAGSGYFSNSIITSGTLVFANPNVSPVGVMQWDDGEGTVSLGLKGGNVNLEIGQEELALCYNGTGSTITKGKVVYIIGAVGQKPSIGLASNDTEINSSKTLGIVAEDIASGFDGFVTTYGIVRNIDTSSFIEGSGLWLSSSGDMTMIRPIQPLHGVHIGYCLKNSAEAGRIFVRVQNGFEIDELHNVLISNLASGDLLQYNSSLGLWQNKSAVQAGAIGATGLTGATGIAGATGQTGLTGATGSGSGGGSEFHPFLLIGV